MKKVIVCLWMLFVVLNANCIFAEDPSKPPESGKETSAENPIFEKAFELYNQTKYDEAIGLFQEVLKGNPSHLRAQVYYGVCFMGKEDFDRAIGELQKALIMDEKFPLTNYALAVSYARKPNPDVAKSTEYLEFAKKYGYQVPIWFEQYLERLKTGKTAPQQQSK